MAPKPLPPHPCLDQYKKQAKELLARSNSGDSEAIHRIDTQLPPAKRNSMNGRRLADAQLAIAREFGAESWPRFVKLIESANNESSNQVWQAAEKAVIAGDEATLARLLSLHSQMFQKEQPPSHNGLTPNHSKGDVRTILVNSHEFEDWESFQRFLEARSLAGSPVSQFEASADAIVNGDIRTLRGLLDSNGDLSRARSVRKHHSTLLHYIGANGVEYWRQRTPRNAVQIAELLLDYGSEIDATADMYGGGNTPLSLVATSVHPVRAHLQKPLMKLLVSRGASIGDAGAVNGCLANGRQSAAEWLAEHGAPLDLEGAAGVGRLDLVKTYFNPDQSFANGATTESMDRAFAWACEYGRTKVVEFLLRMGMHVDAPLRNHGQTGLHWASLGAHISVAKLLLKHGARIGIKDPSFGGTPLSWAIHGWGDPPPGTPVSRYHAIVKLLVSAGAEVDSSLLQRADVVKDSIMSAALRSESRAGDLTSPGEPTIR